MKGFEKTWTVLIVSGVSVNYGRRSTMEENQLYVGALAAKRSASVRLTTGTRVTVPKASVDLDVKLSDIDSMESCRGLYLVSRYDLILGMT